MLAVGCDFNKKTINNNMEEKNGINTAGIYEPKKLGDLLIEITNVTYENEISTLTTSINNNGDNPILVNTINMTFWDNEGKEIISILGYLGNLIEPGEYKILKSSVDMGLSNAADVEYKLND